MFQNQIVLDLVGLDGTCQVYLFPISTAIKGINGAMHWDMTIEGYMPASCLQLLPAAAVGSTYVQI